MRKPSHAYRVREWLYDRIDCFGMKKSFSTTSTNLKEVKALIGELKAIIKEAELRLENPKFPEKL